MAKGFLLLAFALIECMGRGVMSVPADDTMDTAKTLAAVSTPPNTVNTMEGHDHVTTDPGPEERHGGQSIITDVAANVGNSLRTGMGHGQKAVESSWFLTKVKNFFKMFRKPSDEEIRRMEDFLGLSHSQLYNGEISLLTYAYYRGAFARYSKEYRGYFKEVRQIVKDIRAYHAFLQAPREADHPLNLLDAKLAMRASYGL
uniref:RxLR effector protein n=1 Tax=Peronospora matthiolae TaxID=2874970 RepID=A0AAV1UQ16_9STRA